MDESTTADCDARTAVQIPDRTVISEWLVRMSHQLAFPVHCIARTSQGSRIRWHSNSVPSARLRKVRSAHDS